MKSKKIEKIMELVFFLCALVSVLSILLICYFIFINGAPFIKNYGIGNFLLGKKWAPTNSPASFGIFPMIMGSVYVTMGAIIIGVPIGILTAVYLVYFCNNKVYKFLKPALNLMSGIPSVIYGFFALNLIAPLIRTYLGGTGMSILTASLLLGIMILPTIIGLSESSIRSVPKNYYEGSIALGATHERSVMRVVVPAAKSGIFASIILGVGRAIGETMAVILIAGNQALMPRGVLKGVRTMTTNIVMDMAYASGQHREALIATSLVLFVFILFINFLFNIFKRRMAN